ncbi:MAG: hypothetical protein JW959_07825 [Pirellulales bacterium]|nr:hypothetical protein [Pirellulales bacterium]
MAIICPRCGANYDATLFEFGRRVRCACGAEVEYPGDDLRGGHVASDSPSGDLESDDRPAVAGPGQGPASG